MATGNILDLSGQRFLDPEFQRILAQNPKTTVLIINGCQNITDAGAAALKTLNELYELHAQNLINLTPKGSREIPTQHLMVLDLSTTSWPFKMTRRNSLELIGFDDSSCTHLKDALNLAYLDVSNSASIGDEGMQSLIKHNTQMKTLKIDAFTQITQLGLANLGNLRYLTTLILNACFDENALIEIGKITTLEVIKLGNYSQTDISPEALKNFSQLPLKSVALDGFSTTLTGIHALPKSIETLVVIPNNRQDLQAVYGWIPEFRKLTSLTINQVNSTNDLGNNWNLDHLSQLTELTLQSPCSDPEAFKMMCKASPQLTTLTTYTFGPGSNLMQPIAKPFYESVLELEHLQKFVCKQNSPDDFSLRLLHGQAPLEWLSVNATPDVIEALSQKATTVQNLFLSVSDANTDLSKLGNMVNLQYLVLYTSVTIPDESYKFLASLQNLTYLNIYPINECNTGVGEQALQWIGTLPKLEILRLANFDFPDKALQGIIHSPVQYLYLENGANLSDNAETHLAQLKQLRFFEAAIPISATARSNIATATGAIVEEYLGEYTPNQP